MKRVTGIGGIFFRAKNVDGTREWYRQHLGIEPEDFGGHIFKWRYRDHPEQFGSTVWSLFPDDTTYFGENPAQFMINYRVDDLDQVLKALEAEGIKIEGRMEEHSYGKFAWITDPEGIRIELWEPANKD
jgi:catechol 2,3-dioxygenase-like lactoylglutathione lyase family enzyme